MIDIVEAKVAAVLEEIVHRVDIYGPPQIPGENYYFGTHSFLDDGLSLLAAFFTSHLRASRKTVSHYPNVPD